MIKTLFLTVIMQFIVALIFSISNCTKDDEKSINNLSDTTIDTSTDDHVIQCELKGSTVKLTCPHIYLTTILLDEDTAWIGTYGSNLIKYSLSSGTYSKIEFYDESAVDYIDEPSVLVSPKIIDSNGNKWINVGGDLYSVKGDKIERAPITVRDMVKDEQKLIWAINYSDSKSVDDRLIFYRQIDNEWKPFKFNDKQNPLTSFSKIYIKDSADIWIAGSTTCAAIANFNGSDWTLYDAEHNPFDNNIVIRDIVEDDNGQVLFGMYSGIMIFDGEKWKTVNLPPTKNIEVPPSNEIYSFYKYDDTLWIISGQGIGCIKDSTWIEMNLTWPYKEVYIKYYDKYVLIKDNNSTLWCVTPPCSTSECMANGRFNSCYLISSQSVIKIIINPLRPCVSFPINITCLQIDKNGNKWIGTASKGLLVLKGDSIQSLNAEKGYFSSDTVSCICLDSSGVIWVATKNLLFSLNSDGDQFTSYPIPLTNISSISAWSGSRIFVCGTGGVVELNGEVQKIYSMNNSALTTDAITTGAVDKNGTLFVGTDRGGMCVLNDTQWTVYNQYNSSFNGNKITEITVDQNNVKWVVTSKVIYTFDNDTFSRPSYVNEIVADYADFSGVVSFSVGEDSTIWLGFGKDKEYIKNWYISGRLYKIKGKMSYGMARDYVPHVIVIKSPSELLLGTSQTVEYFTVN